MGIKCRKCRYYHVTWDKRAPHGCRVFGFKGKMLPGIIVRHALSGVDCMHYEMRKPGYGTKGS